jgi:hypothetical protein
MNWNDEKWASLSFLTKLEVPCIRNRTSCPRFLFGWFGRNINTRLVLNLSTPYGNEVYFLFPKRYPAIEQAEHYNFERRKTSSEDIEWPLARSILHPFYAFYALRIHADKPNRAASIKVHANAWTSSLL